jgi:hypothetical protein
MKEKMKISYFNLIVVVVASYAIGFVSGAYPFATRIQEEEEIEVSDEEALQSLMLCRDPSPRRYSHRAFIVSRNGDSMTFAPNGTSCHDLGL